MSKEKFWYDKDSLDKASDAVDKELSNTFIPTLEGDEAEEFVRKAESAERATVEWGKQMKQMELALNKSRIANRELKYGKGEAPKVKRSKDVEE
jgi:hypothetical protein